MAARSLLALCRTHGARLALLALLFGSYFGSLALAARYFPKTYDWRSNVISNLLSPRDNPHYYWVPSIGVALAGVCMLPLILWIEAQLGDRESRLARWVRKPAFLAGVGCLVLAALVVPQHVHPVLGMKRLHEALARTSALGFGIGMLCACRSALWKSARPRLRWMGAAWSVLTVVPLAGVAISGFLLLLARAGWFPPGAEIGRALRGTIWWHLAFWEWFGSAAVFFFFASSVLWLAPKLESSPVR